MISVVSRRANSSVPGGSVRVYIGRPSPLGNPFVIGRDGNREEVIRKYEQWAVRAMKSQPAFRDAFLHLVQTASSGNVELECWCSPLGCHGDVLKKMIEEVSQPK